MYRKFYKYTFLFYSFFIFLSTCLSQENNEEKNKFEIDEINIKFQETSTYSESDIKNLIASREGEIFERETYLLDVVRIKKFYFDNGFFDTVVDTNVIFNNSDKEVIENFIINENKRYRYYEVKYIGLDSIDQSVKEKVFKSADKLIREGKYYSKDTIKLEGARVIDILNNNGYALANSQSPEVLKYETNNPSLKHKVNLSLVFVPGFRYVFGSTRISFKNQKYTITKEDVEREITYSENQVYDKEEVVNSELNLNKIVILENPRITFDRIDSVNKKIYLVVNAIVGSKYNLKPELFGYYLQNIFYLGTGLSFSDNYFFGGSKVLTTSARFYFHSFQDNRLELVNTISKPFLFNNRNISGSWNIGIEYRLNEQANITQIKNIFGVAYDLPTYTYINRLTSKWDVENTRFILKEDIIVNNILIEKYDANYFTSILGFGAIHNTVNDIQFPFKGTFQSYEIQEAGLLGNLVQKVFNTATLNFVKFTNFNSTYYNLTDREIRVSSVLAGKISTGIIFEYGENDFTFQGIPVNNDLIPSDDKFVCGGSSSIRGWGAKQLGIVENKGIGGNFIIENSIEHRTRPFLESDNSLIRDLGFATFIDFGNVWSEIGKFKFNELALAAGGGIRYYTIIGAIRFDLGFKIYDPQPGPVGGSNWIFGEGSNYSDKYHFQFGIANTF
ncbi:MAG: BamA/TamA family outer membrane protein [Bacteroidota bacterium]|nr:BamA/TamA family outer membrane protein [Bacteroidota bacterium]